MGFVLLPELEAGQEKQDRQNEESRKQVSNAFHFPPRSVRIRGAKDSQSTRTAADRTA